MQLNRRTFLKTSAAAVAGGVLAVEEGLTPIHAAESVTEQPKNQQGLTAAQIDRLLYTSSYEPCGQIGYWRVGDVSQDVLRSEADDGPEGGFIITMPHEREPLLRAGTLDEIRDGVVHLLATGAVPFAFERQSSKQGQRSDFERDTM